jgi:hypothetical protein
LLLGGIGDADRAGDGEDLGYVAGPAVATVFAVDDITDVVAGVFDEPMGADDLAQSPGVSVGGREAGDVVGPGAWRAGLVSTLALDADDLGCAREVAKQVLAGDRAQVDAADKAVLVASMVMITAGELAVDNGGI